MSAALEATADSFSPGILEAATAENYQLETAMWIGATLEQGVWYEISAPLSVPGFCRESSFNTAFSSRLRVWCPVSLAPTEQTCVEIVIRATPDQEVARSCDRRRQLSPTYTASTEARIVTDPGTLFPTLARSGSIGMPREQGQPGLRPPVGASRVHHELRRRLAACR